ncbi:MAG TPA: hypothetical protein VFA95_01700 [Gammaproteobacteria bacterium]|nr:hypothetical protein [Gammaproteobacteria bacterium]
MTDTHAFAPGNYRFLPGVFQYSGGVVADPDYAIERVRFLRPLPLADGFRRIADHLATAGRPLTALCACELRSPAPFDEAGFGAFNRQYVDGLSRFGLYDGRTNPVARSNVCPEVGPPPAPSLHAFSYTIPVSPGAASFVVAGSAEAPEGRDSYGAHVVAGKDVSPRGIRAKARWVLAEMERRLAALGVGWADTTATQVYTVHDIHVLMSTELARRAAIRAGLSWHFCRPPVVGLEYEMDCRGVYLERVLPTARQATRGKIKKSEDARGGSFSRFLRKRNAGCRTACAVHRGE